MKKAVLTSKVSITKNRSIRCLIFGVLCHLKERKLSHGGVAQLGEHLLCKQGVIGSSPFISTNTGS